MRCPLNWVKLIFRILAMQDTVQGLDAHPSGANQRWDVLSIAPK